MRMFSEKQVSSGGREVAEGREQGERGFVATEGRRGTESMCGLWAGAYRWSKRVNKVNPPSAVGSTDLAACGRRR